MKAMVLGATGLTGHLVVQGLLAREEIESVTVLVRRPLELEHPRLIQHQVDFDSLDSHADLFAVDALICCLGTTIRTAGSQARFREVDYGYPLAAARLAREQGARALILMSAIGASSSSTIFYNRVKGELEDAVRELVIPTCRSIIPVCCSATDRSTERVRSSVRWRCRLSTGCCLAHWTNIARSRPKPWRPLW
ncbi:NAD(P)H-binding protein [Marinobacter koreensis]|uniref:NAD(P)H-binding protein n=1 Tax=Marinobacter koreensis TaxID=335974 RepID=UPI00360EBCE4